MSGIKRNEPVAFIVRCDAGSQGVCAMDVQEVLAKAFGYSREQVEVEEIAPRQYDCSIEGHSFLPISQVGSPDPLQIICDRCGRSWRIEDS